jgi:hypothetical protein
MYFNFRSAVAETGLIGDNPSETVTGLAMNGSTGYNSGNDWDEQPGYTINTGWGSNACGVCMPAMSASSIPSYHFFSTGDSVHVVVETTGGKFQFISFGCLVKQGVYTGGQYFSGSYPTRNCEDQYWDVNEWYKPGYFTVPLGLSGPNGMVYFDADATAGWRYSGVSPHGVFFPCVQGTLANSSYGRSGLASHFWKKAPSAYNSMAAMCPIFVLGLRSDSNLSLLGWPEGVRALNSTMYSPGEEVVFGSDTWLIFTADSFDDLPPLNTYVGFAFKKVT